MIIRERNEVLGDLGDPSAPRGSAPWVKSVFEHAKATLLEADSTIKHARFWIDALIEDGNFRQLKDQHGRNFALWEVFCTTRQPFGLGYEPEAIDAIVRERDQDRPVSEVITLRPHGRPPKEQGESTRGEKGDVITLNQVRRGTTGAPYLKARLARDRPDILERMKAGEFRSVRAAALEAGFVRPTFGVYADDPIATSRSLLRHLTGDDLLTLLRELANHAGYDLIERT